MSDQKVNNIFPWITNRCPPFSIDIDLNNLQKSEDQRPSQFDNLYINLSNVIKHLLSKQKFRSVLELCNVLKQKLQEIINLIGPQKIVYMSLDGTKPAALLKKEKEEFFKMGDFSGNFISVNHLIPQMEGAKQLTSQLFQFISEVLEGDEKLKNVNIIYSDSAIPGDATQKIKEFIKNIKQQPKFDPNTVHCIVDDSTEGFLIGLSTHEIQFYNLNCTTFNSSQYKCIKCKRKGHFFDSCLGKEDNNFQTVASNPHYQLYNYQEFRKFMEFEFSYLNFNAYNPERVLDDFVLLVILQGCLTLPKLNFFSMEDGGLDSIFYLYKRALPHLGYLTDDGRINQNKLSLLFRDMGAIEDIGIKNFIRSHIVDKFKTQKAQEAWNKFIKDLKLKIKQDYAVEEEEEAKQLEEERLIQCQQQQEQLNLQKIEEEKNQNQLKSQIQAENDNVTISSGDVIKQLIQKHTEETIEQTGKTREELGIKDFENENQQQQPQEQEYQEKSIPPAPTSNLAPSSVPQKQDADYCNMAKIQSQQFQCIDNAYEAFEDIQIDFNKYAERFFEGISFNETFNKPDEVSLTSLSNWDNLNEEEKRLYMVGEKDFKKEFYIQKFKLLESDFNQFLPTIQENYMAALKWTYSYFYFGYESWKWQYAYSYAPFFSDIFKEYGAMKIEFEPSSPIKTLDYQIIMTHPSQAQTLPKAFQHLYTDSEIMDLWPFQYSYEYNWNYTEEVVIIPYFDIDRLQQTTQRYETILEDDELKANRVGKLYLFSQNPYLNDQENQHRKRIECEKDNIAGELFITLQEVQNTSTKMYALLLPQSTYQGSYKPLEGAKQDYLAQYNYDMAEILDGVLYCENQLIKQIERILYSNIDRSELYNKGQIIEEQAPPQAPIGKFSTNNSMYTPNKKSIPPRQNYQGNQYGNKQYSYGYEPYKRGRYN